MRLNPKEQEKLMLHMAGNMAKERKGNRNCFTRTEKSSRIEKCVRTYGEGQHVLFDSQ